MLQDVRKFAHTIEIRNQRLLIVANASCVNCRTRVCREERDNTARSIHHHIYRSFSFSKNVFIEASSLSACVRAGRVRQNKKCKAHGQNTQTARRQPVAAAPAHTVIALLYLWCDTIFLCAMVVCGT